MKQYSRRLIDRIGFTSLALGLLLIVTSLINIVSERTYQGYIMGIGITLFILGSALLLQQRVSKRLSNIGTAVSFGLILISIAVALNTWYHVAVTYNGSVESIYINGSVDTSYSTSGNVSTPLYTENISIGAYNWNNFTQRWGFFNGFIDELRVWNISRTQALIQAMMNSELSGTEPGLMGYWRFNGNVLDGSPNGNNGTIFGNPIFVPVIR